VTEAKVFQRDYWEAREHWLACKQAVDDARAALEAVPVRQAFVYWQERSPHELGVSHDAYIEEHWLRYVAQAGLPEYEALRRARAALSAAALEYESRDRLIRHWAAREAYLEMVGC
jgi:hypothetical protein